MTIKAFRNLVISLAACTALAAPMPVMAGGFVDDRPTFGDMFVDGLVVRPLGLCATVLGSVTWLVTLPFSALGGNLDEAGEKLVADPARFTFTRPLGEL